MTELVFAGTRLGSVEKLALSLARRAFCFPLSFPCGLFSLSRLRELVTERTASIFIRRDEEEKTRRGEGPIRQPGQGTARSRESRINNASADKPFLCVRVRAAGGASAARARSRFRAPE